MKRFLLLALLLASVPALGALNLGSTDNLLEPEKAFRFSARALEDGAVEVRFAIADGYYLYRERFRFEATGARLGKAEFPPGIAHKDEFFGEQQIYRRDVRIRVPAEASGRFELKVTSQGCADAGVCYVPMESTASVSLTGGAPVSRPSIFSSDLEVAQLFQNSTPLVLGGFLVFGLLLAFTPCVLPMIPILSGIIAGEGASLSKSRALGLSLSYVIGMALAYAIAGVAAAYSGSLLAAALQNAWVLGAFALVFVVLALSMFGLYELKLPGFLHHRLDEAQRRLPGGRIASVASMGALSAVIVSPCVAAPLAGALLYIAQTRDVALGGAALFTMALGMGIPLIAVGVSEGALLPKSGPWLNRVKQFFGVLLLAVAAWIVSPLFLTGKGDTKFVRIDSIAELDAKLAAPGKPVMLDFYADWCVSCKEMEHFTFSEPAVKKQLDGLLLLQVDVTANTAEHKALLKRFSLFGPPGIIFFDAQGREIKGLRVIGYQNAERFLKTLSLATTP
ncbi:MAG: thioredoxin:protein disulfide reductase [Betaproteobacteria bacterium]|nr:thioredoxin:protein disulfide reductase [Betaproteobacteria bacterium]